MRFVRAMLVIGGAVIGTIAGFISAKEAGVWIYVGLGAFWGGAIGWSITSWLPDEKD